MYILTFGHSRSCYFKKGLDHAISLGGEWDGNTLTIKIPDDELMIAYHKLLDLFSIIQNWSSLKATFNGNPVEPYQFILSMHFMQECASTSRHDPENCFVWPEIQGWGCKKLLNVYYVIRGTGKYSYNEKFWYNFGKFNDKNEWHIDKDTLYDKLAAFAEKEGLQVCPHFSFENVKTAVDELPSVIIPDDKNYRIHYEEDFYKGKKIQVPVNIRHISEEWDDYDFGERKFNWDAIQPIIHYEREVNPNATEEVLKKPISKN